MISGYSIQKEIGNGGMATVYLAVQESVDRLVALKVLRPEFSQSLEYADRFLREAKLAASLSHPNLVPPLHTPTTVRYAVVVQLLGALGERHGFAGCHRQSPNRGLPGKGSPISTGTARVHAM